MEMATVLMVGLWLVILGQVSVFRREQRWAWGRVRATEDEVLRLLEQVAAVQGKTRADVANFERGVMTRLTAVGDAVGVLAADR